MKRVLSLVLLSAFLFLLFFSPALVIMFQNTQFPFINIKTWLFAFFGLSIGWLLFGSITPLVNFNRTYSKTIQFVKLKLHPNEKLLLNKKVYFSLKTPNNQLISNLEKNLYRQDVKNLFWNGPNFAGIFITTERLFLIRKTPEQNEFETVLEIEGKVVKKVKMSQEVVATSEYTVSWIKEIILMLYYALLLRVAVPTGGMPSIMGIKLNIDTDKGEYLLRVGVYKFLRLSNNADANVKLRTNLEMLFKNKLV